MNENAHTKTLLLTDIPLADFELIELEAQRQQRPVVFILRAAVATMARRIEARERRKAEQEASHVTAA